MRNVNNKGFSVVEYTMLIVIVIGAFLVMSNYIQRGLFGKWGQSGQTFAYGRQYDPQKSIECSFDEQSNLWYDHNCYDEAVATYCSVGTCNNSICADGTSCGAGGNVKIEEDIITSNTCIASSCSQINNST